MYLDPQNNHIFPFAYLNQRIGNVFKKIVEKNCLYQKQNRKNLEKGGWDHDTRNKRNSKKKTS